MPAETASLSLSRWSACVWEGDARCAEGEEADLVLPAFGEGEGRAVPCAGCAGLPPGGRALVKAKPGDGVRGKSSCMRSKRLVGSHIRP